MPWRRYGLAAHFRVSQLKSTPVVVNDSGSIAITGEPMALRKLSMTLAVIFILILGCDQFHGGPSRPAVVDGDSMAPHLVGQHHSLECLECGHEFLIENVAIDYQAVCPNCGYAEVATSAATLKPAARVKLVPPTRAPKRWSVVGVQLDNQQDAVVKRIVGLPGERIDIRNGDLFNQQGILRKPWSVQKEMRIPVFDSSKQSLVPFETAKRFRVSEQGSWDIGKRLRFNSNAAHANVQWLDYVHWRNCKRNGPRDAEFGIDDLYGFNQTTVRGLSGLDDLHIEIDLEFVENGSSFVFAWRRTRESLNPAMEHLIRLKKVEDGVEIEYQGSKERKPLQRQRFFDSELAKIRFLFSSFDRELVLKLDGDTVLQLKEKEDEAPQAGQESLFDETCKQPFRIGSDRGNFVINRLAIWRDVHYSSGPTGIQAISKTLEAKGGYILLGDNSPRSLDSRVWDQAEVAPEQIIGEVVPE